MEVLFTVIVIAVVVAILLVPVAALFEMSPFAHHVERYRDSSGRRVGSSPRLD
jgi:hypothetical protein